MTNQNSNIELLLEKLEILLKRQEYFSKEIQEIQEEIYRIKAINSNQEKIEDKTDSSTTIIPNLKDIPNLEETPIKEEIVIEHITPLYESIPVKEIIVPKGKSNIEKFIGENLLNKIGILITIIGVSIGAKYSIENDLISPLTRIVLGYFMGLGLLGLGIKLKKKYLNYSAVLVSGAMAILYFITFSAYSFYDLIPQSFTFILMFIFTGFTVFAALNYNKQIIAHIGLVGAYAVPFLLSDGSGKVAVLFSYMAIINIGILIIAFKKYWKYLYYVSFALTWLIYASWYIFDYYTDTHFNLGLIFLTLFFVIFYSTFLAYKLNQKEKFATRDIILLLLNSFLFYGIGYSILSGHEIGKQLLGLFTLLNAIIHFGLSLLIYKKKLADKNLFYLVTGLVLVFITITIPVQLDGNWVTLLWVSEAALLFWIGRTKSIAIYERISYSLMILSFFSIAQDWGAGYHNYYYGTENSLQPILNIYFLTSILFIAAFGFITKLSRNLNYASAISKVWLKNIFSYLIPGIFLFTFYYSFQLEIENYFNILYSDSAIKLTEGTPYYKDTVNNQDISRFQIIWTLIYSLIFLTVFSFIVRKKLKDTKLFLIPLGLSALLMVVYLMQGLFELSELRVSYLEQTQSEYYNIGVFNIGIRYLTFVFVALLLLESFKLIKAFTSNSLFTKATYLALNIIILWIVSSELISWLDIVGVEQSYKLGLSILWGCYSLSMIAYGIWKNKQFIRVGAIVLFGVTLIKLFFYDISHLNTIAKTIVFVSLGILLLIISFLYNKYKNKITDDDENNQ